MTARLEGMHIPTPPEGYYWKIGGRSCTKIILAKKNRYWFDREVGSFYTFQVYHQKGLTELANKAIQKTNPYSTEEDHWYRLTVYANSRKEA